MNRSVIASIALLVVLLFVLSRFAYMIGLIIGDIFY